MTEQNGYDEATQINDITWRYEIGGRAEARIDRVRMRIFFPQELDALMCWQGFEIEQKLGDYDGTPFASRTPKQLIICKLG